MARDITAATERSPEDLSQVLSDVQTPEQARTLQSAYDYLTEQQLLDADSLELIQAHLSELGLHANAAAGATSSSNIFGIKIVQAGLAIAGVGGIAAAAGGGGGGGGGHSQAAPPAEVSPTPVIEPTPPEIVEQPVTEPTPPVVVQPPVTEPTPPVAVQPPVTEPTPPIVVQPPVTEPTPPVVVQPPVTEPTPPVVVQPPVTEPTPPVVVQPPVTEPTPPVVVQPPVTEPTPPVVVEPPVTEPTPPVVVQPPVTEPEEPPVNQPSPPQFSKPSQREYDVNPGMKITGIQTAHSRGYTGSSALVAILDTGFYSEHLDLQGQFAGFYNAFTRSENAADAIDNDGHGTHVAGIIAAKASGYGTVGYAPDTKLLGVRIGDDNGELTTSSAQTAAAFKWAREKGAHFINNSWGDGLYTSQVNSAFVEHFYQPEITEFRTGAQNHVIYVWANGNEGTSQPGLYAALPQLFPELKANWVAVANVDASTGRLDDTSQRCGDAKDWCISAPGTNVWAPYPDAQSNEMYAQLTGTSMAAPAVTGTLAALKDAFPMLTNEQIVTRLFVTADKNGVYADQDLYGQGLMDADKASMPLGPMSLMGASGEAAPLSTTALKMGGAFGNSNPLEGVTVMALDVQGAGFMTDLGDVVQPRTYRHDLLAATDRMAKQAPRQVNAGNGMTLTLSQNGADGNAMDNMVMGFADNDGLTTRFGMVSNVDVLAGDLNFAGLSQQKVSFTAPYWMSDSDESAVGLQQGFGLAGGSLSFTAVSSAERTGAAMSYSYNLAKGYAPVLEVGLVNGKDSLFGTETSGALRFSDKAETRFVGLRGEYKRNALTLFHSAYMGQSDVSARGLISGIDTVATSSWLVGGKFDQGINQYGLIVAQPLKVESANTSFSFIDGYKNGAFTSSTVNVDLAPTGRQINTEFYFATSTRAINDIKLSLMRMDQPGHNAAASADHVATLSLGSRF